MLTTGDSVPQPGTALLLLPLASLVLELLELLLGDGLGAALSLEAAPVMGIGCSICFA